MMPMRSAMLLGCALAAGSAAADLVPLSAITNGSFDANLARWAERDACRVHPQWVPVGATPIGGAALVREGQPWCTLGQNVAGPLPDVTLASWWAQVAQTPNVNTGQGMGLYANAGARLLNADLWEDKVQFQAFGSALQDIPFPGLAGPGRWYEVVLVRPTLTGHLFIDGNLTATATGPGAPQPDFLWFGDGANSGCCTASPDVTWDEFYVGPAP
ncbi:MAG TPA: hypothetical protein VGR28_07835 [Candidatus Thermoplasmatota archaeon]|jgi:hypothetical protein|nr:hypothetical protein [Candidatus Thermoplasmatota archaeon]